MSDNENNKKRRPLKSIPPDGFPLKTGLIWVLIIGAIVALFLLNPAKSPQPAVLNVQEVLELAEQGKIAKGNIRSDSTGGKDWHVMSGETTEPILRNAAGLETKAFTMSDRVTDSSYEKLQKTKVIVAKPATTAMTQLLYNILPFILVIGLLYFLFVRQLKSAGKGALSFGKSRAKMLTRDKDRITFADVAGCDEAKEEVGEVVEFLKDPKKFQKIGGRIPKGILMVGPPGTGKTLLAKAIAGEADVPFFSISGSDFVEMFVGVGASRVRDMFEQGRKNAPCLIFIDEIDAVGRQRGAGLGGGNDEREQTLNSLLVEMDGFDTQEGVIIIAATNRPDVLDSALLRPGRFDRQVTIDLPDIVGREQILRVHARKIALSDNVELAVIARGTPGLSGAELANLLNEAALLAARRNKKKVDMSDIDEARDKILWGRERRRVMDDKEKQALAWHEAGHAIVGAVLDDGTVPVHKVTIIPRGQSLGSTTYIPTKDILGRTKKQYLDRICTAMAGRIAEEFVTGDISDGASGDIKQATKIARMMVCDLGMSELGPISMGDNQDTVFLGRDITRSQHISEETARRVDAAVTEIITGQYKRASEILTGHRAALDKVAAALLEHETIEGVHVTEIIKHGEIKSPVVAVKPPKLPPADSAKPAGKSTSEASDGPAGAPAPSPA
ncbi:ATP-dependent zinc metalloprotease FtsH [Oleiharenicola lentus]|jgi:cell division protease FtsH|uniref:ATP-dependent zinc metalloprotease FtsH n=1 Tax=Oleiharenicola lentus TaxID=2508720 RepID=A0A4V1M6N7_9BACT|nr:ATP-dependent zinc metalloprotease FtsH [Oleiharenicola lentus]RXK56039.1 ATP-dependent zinc metalloprotease FtsH [Oleiharenicola lentus]